MARMRVIGNSLDNGYRDDLNFNFSLLESLVGSSDSMNEQLKKELTDMIDNLQLQINTLAGENIENLIARINDSVQQALTSAQEARTATTATEKAAANANTASSLANANAFLAEEKANYANEKGALAQQAADKANAESSNLSQLKIDVVNATQGANTAKDNAVTATQQAQTATETINSILPNVTGLENKLNWNGSESYKKNNFVYYMGNGYIALKDNSNSIPPVPPSYSNANWSLYALKGEKGEQGTGVNIIGELNNEGELPPTGEQGQAYLINGDLWVWTENASQWSNIGNIQGPQGIPGENGKSAYQEWIDLGNSGTEQDFINYLKANVTIVNDLTTGGAEKAFSAEQGKVVNQKIVNHEGKIASTEELGHFKPDGDTITVDPETGVATAIGGNSIGGIPVDVSNIKNGEGIVYDASKNKFIPSVNIAKPIIFGVKIDTTNSNPESALTYTDNAIGFTPAKGNNGAFSYGSWEDKFPFNQIKPCVVKNGVFNYYLNPNDYTKKITGGASGITSGNDGDVMVEFPKIYWKFETIGTDLYIRYSDAKIDSAYKCLAHTRGTTEKDKIYLSAYMGNELSGKLRSLSGKTPTVSQTIGAFRTLAKANGTGYEQATYYQLLMLQVLFIVMFKNRDSQTALGRGYVDGNSASIVTGGTNTKGMFYGETTGKLQNKFCGIEDFWGNTYYWIDGLYCDASRNILIGNDNFNDTGSGYMNYGQGATVNLSGYIDEVQGGTETGFIIKSGSGSATMHYSDYGAVNASRLPIFGANWDYGSYGGAFRLYSSSSAASVSPTLSARLSCF